MICPKCGNENSEDSIKCFDCGEILRRNDYNRYYLMNDNDLMSVYDAKIANLDDKNIDIISEILESRGLLHTSKEETNNLSHDLKTNKSNSKTIFKGLISLVVIISIVFLIVKYIVPFFTSVHDVSNKISENQNTTKSRDINDTATTKPVKSVTTNNPTMKPISESTIAPTPKSTVEPFNPQAYKNKCKTITYNDLARKPDDYAWSFFTFVGEVVQTMEDDANIITMRVNITEVEFGYSDTIMVLYQKKNDEPRILEGDIISIWGISEGLTSYTSTQGVKITLPLIYAEILEIQGTDNSSQFIEGEMPTYEQLARNPSKYFAYEVKFTGEVIQVLEDGNRVEMRVNVTKYEYDFYTDTVYVFYEKKDGEARILENDIITFEGLYYGIFTYTSTTGMSVSIPCVTATAITIK